MATSETVAAATANWIELFKGMGPILGPLVAFCGALLLYFRKLKDDRLAAIRAKRADLYDEYVTAINDVLQESDEDSIISCARKVANRLLPIHGRLSVLAPPEVVNESFAYIKALVELHGTSYEKPTSQVTGLVEFTAHMEVNRRLGNARQSVINAFRRDVYPDARDLPASMKILDAEGDSLLTMLGEELKKATRDVSNGGS